MADIDQKHCVCVSVGSGFQAEIMVGWTHSAEASVLC